MKSNQISMSSAKDGQKIVRPFGRDDSSYNAGSVSERKNGSVKGSQTNLAHSLSGSSVSGPLSSGGGGNGKSMND